MHVDAAAYALVSLDDAEVAEFEAHLAICTFCQREVAEFCDTAAKLSLLSEATPPRRLRGKVLGLSQTLLQLPPEDNADRLGMPSLNGHTSTDLPPMRPPGPRRALPGWEISDEPEPEPRPVAELEVRRQRRRSRILSGLVAALLIVTVGAGGVVYTLVQQVHQRDEAVAQRFKEEQVVRAEVARVVVAPASVGGRCTMVVSEKMNKALYLGTNMPDPGQGKQYQLWTGTGTRRDPTYVLDNPVPNVRPWRQLFRGDVAKADFLVVSVEAQGSTPAAPTEIVAFASLRT